MTIITRRRGDTYADLVTVTEPIVPPATVGVPIDITGYSFKMTLDPEKTPATAANNLYQLTGTIIDAPAGKVEFAPTEEQANQTPGTYFYDIQLIDGAGRKRTIALDKYVYTQDITKD